MKLFRRQTEIRKLNELFEENGEFNLNEDSAILLDSVLFILMALGSMDLCHLNLELRRCGFFLNNIDLRKVIDKMVDDEVITDKKIMQSLLN